MSDVERTKELPYSRSRSWIKSATQLFPSQLYTETPAHGKIVADVMVFWELKNL
jgi:hypothetical protein